MRGRKRKERGAWRPRKSTSRYSSRPTLDIAISCKAMSIMNSFINNIFEELVCEPADRVHYNKKPTISS
jgi:hypothetical protein